MEVMPVAKSNTTVLSRRMVLYLHDNISNSSLDFQVPDAIPIAINLWRACWDSRPSRKLLVRLFGFQRVAWIKHISSDKVLAPTSCTQLGREVLDAWPNRSSPSSFQVQE